VCHLCGHLVSVVYSSPTNPPHHTPLNAAAAGKLLAKYEGQLPTRLWVAPPTRMDETQLVAEGYYSTYGKVRLVCIALFVM
jgi:hypothetical protein